MVPTTVGHATAQPTVAQPLGDGAAAEVPPPAVPTARALAPVLNIQRFSTHDGPGIRTTVFLKGCSNACAWCHNPESLRAAPQLQEYPDRCIACGRCVVVCPRGAQRLEPAGRSVDRGTCVACGRCVEECFTGALTMAGRPMSVEAVLAAVGQDRVYYRRSGGGVTFSGGEPVLHRPFLADVLRACRQDGIHTAIQTAGHYPWAWLAEALHHVDLVLFDVKSVDPQVHREWIGNDGETIRANLRRLAGQGVRLAVRTPVVSPVNDTEAAIDAIARLVAELDHLDYYQLIPYHPLGEAKRASLGMAREERCSAPDRHTLERLADVARRHLPNVRL